MIEAIDQCLVALAVPEPAAAFVLTAMCVIITGGA
jgi:hypothetical protein